MEKYIHLFNTQAEFEAAYDSEYKEPWLSCVKESGFVGYNIKALVLPDQPIYK